MDIEPREERVLAIEIFLFGRRGRGRVALYRGLAGNNCDRDYRRTRMRLMIHTSNMETYIPENIFEKIVTVG